MRKLVYLGPDPECRTHFGVRARGVPFVPGDGEEAFVAQYLPGHRFGPAEDAPQDFAARTKPAPARKK